METKKLNRQGIKTLLFALAFAIIVVGFMTSCSARKVQKYKTEIKETTQTETTKIDSSKTTITADSNTKIIDTGTEEEFTIIPLDNSKEMVVEGKRYFNTALKHKKVNNNKVTTSGVKVSESTQKSVKTNVKAKNSKSVVAEMKVTNKKQFNFLSLWWLLLVIPVYFAWKKLGKYLPF